MGLLTKSQQEERDEIAKTISKETHFKVKDSEKKSWSLFGWLFGKS